MSELIIAQRLSVILKKDPTALSPGEIEYLTARRGYLTLDQAKTFESVLSGQPEQPQQPTEDPQEDQEIDLTTLKRAELEDLAIELGIQDPQSISNMKELRVAIEMAYMEAEE